MGEIRIADGGCEEVAFQNDSRKLEEEKFLDDETDDDDGVNDPRV